MTYQPTELGSMTERERILNDMREEIRYALLEGGWDVDITEGYVSSISQIAAEAALRVIEKKPDSQEESYSGICTCDQSGYPENSPYSNHPHREGCPQYTGVKPILGG
jgi:hypothetical protein